MSEQSWETHYTGCTRRYPSVAYPRHACEECRAFERGVQAARDAVAAMQSMTGLLGKAVARASIDALRGEAND